MAKVAVIKTGEQYFASCIANNQQIKLDKFIFANVPYVTGSTEVNVNGTLPTASQIKHTAGVTQSGLISDNAVVYSVVLDSTVGDFEFNYIGLMNSETYTLCMVLHTDVQQKLKTQGQGQGNTLTESLWLEIDGAAKATGITVNAETWMIDYSSRMAGEDERIRLSNLDHYGRLAIHSGFKITYLTGYTINAGVAYVAGLRVEHLTAQSMTAKKGESIYLDAWLSGTVTGAWSVNYKIVVGIDLSDYKDGIFQHYVEKIATIGDPGVIQKPNIYSVVNSVNGESGQVTVTPQKINAVSKGGDTMNGDLTFSGERRCINFSYGNHTIVSTTHFGFNLNGSNNSPITRLWWNKSTDTWVFENGAVTIDGKLALKQGDAGLASSAPYLPTNVEYLTTTGFYSLRAGSLSSPEPSGNLCGISVMGSATYGWDILSSERAQVYIRGIANGKISKQLELITTANLNTLVASYPIGAPIDWFSDEMPDDGHTYLYMDGTAFDKNKYPKLAKVYPFGKTSDVRGLVRRAMDNGRGLDLNRVVGSYQDDSIQEITGYFRGLGRGNAVGDWRGSWKHAGYWNASIGSGNGDNWGDYWTLDPEKIKMANETRMKNIACHVITRAA